MRKVDLIRPGSRWRYNKEERLPMLAAEVRLEHYKIWGTWLDETEAQEALVGFEVDAVLVVSRDLKTGVVVIKDRSGRTFEVEEKEFTSKYRPETHSEGVLRTARL